MSWLTWKARLMALGAGLLALLAFVLRHAQVKKQRDDWKHKAKEARADAEWRANLEERDNEIDQEHSERVKQADEDIKGGTVPNHLGNPRRR